MAGHRDKKARLRGPEEEGDLLIQHDGPPSCAQMGDRILDHRNARDGSNQTLDICTDAVLRTLQRGSKCAKSYKKTILDGQGVAQQGDNYGVININNGASKRQKEPDADHIKLELLRKSLTFDRMDARLHNVEPAFIKTCRWLFRHEKFIVWNDKSKIHEHNGFLWIKGKPGCGKSTIMKCCLDWAKKNWSNEWTIMNYFFNARAPDSLEKSSLGLYRSLVYQLLSALPQFAEPFMNKFSSKARDDSVDMWTELELRGFLIDVAQSTTRPNLCLFIDALDEGQEDDVRAMIGFLETLAIHADVSGTPLRVCLSSRHYPHISIEKGISLVVEDEEDHDGDIEAYVENRLLGPKNEQMNKLRTEVCHKSEGIFLWVVLVVSMLNKVRDQGGGLNEMRLRLGELPSDLNGLFADILKKSSHKMYECVLLLQWVLFSTRPLNAAELYLVVKHSVTSEHAKVPFVYNATVLDDIDLDKYLLNCSRGLVEMTKAQPPVLQFIHETVRDFLIDSDGLCQIEPALRPNVRGLSHEALKLGCLKCIRSSSIPKELLTYRTAGYADKGTYEHVQQVLERGFSFIQYAVGNVFRHANKAQECGVSQRPFLNSLTDAQGFWQASDIMEWRDVLERYAARKYINKIPLLYVLAEQNAPHLAQALFDGTIDIDAKGGRYGTALHAACFAGHEEFVQYLVDHGADINTAGGEHGHAMLAAIFGKHPSIVQLLKEHGASPQQDLLDEALFTMVSRVSMQGVLSLITLGANVNSRNGRGEPAIYVAVRRRSVQMLNILLQHGAYPDGFRNINNRVLYGTLQLASQHGLTAIANTLLDKGADVNARDGKFETALQAACYHGHHETVKLLLDKGADVNARGGLYETALQAACCDDHHETVKLLLDKGADVNARGGVYETALQAACYHSLHETAKLLLDKGADVNARGGVCETALQAACCDGHHETVKLLLDKGADVNARGGLYETALRAACCHGHHETVKLLLNKGADANACGG